MKPKRNLRNLTTLIRVFSSAIFFSMGSQHSYAASNITLQASAPDINGNGILGDDVAGNMAAGDFGNVNSIITSGQVSTLLGSSNLTLAATNNITVNSAVSWNSAFGLTLNAGNQISINTGISNAGSGGIALSATTYNLSGGVSFAGTIGLGTLNSSGTVGFTGTANALAVNVQTGTLTLSGNNLADASTVTLSSGSTLSLSGADTAGTLTSNGGTIAGTGVLTAATYGLNTGTSVTGNLGLGTLNSNGTVGITGTAGALNVNVQTGTLTLSGDNLADASAVTVSSGSTLSLSSADTIGTLVSNGGTIAGAGVLTAATYGLNTGTSVTGKLGLGTLNSNGAVGITGTADALSVNVQTGALTLSGNNLADTSLVTLTSGSMLSLSGTDTVGSLVSNGGTIAGMGILTATTYSLNAGSSVTGKLGLGTLNSNGSVSITGSVDALTVNIQSGTMTLAGNGVLGDNSAVDLTGATSVFSIAGISAASETVGSLSGVAGSSVVLGGKNLTTGGNNASTIFAGNLSGAGGSFSKAGTGTLVLTGTNTYTGATNVAAGTLQFARQAALYNNNGASWTKANITVSSGGSIAFNVGGGGEFTNANITSLITELTAGINNNGLMSGSSIGFDTTNAAGGFTVADAIADSTGTGSGSLGVNKLGTNTLILSGVNTYSGGTTVLGGTLQFATQSSLYNGVEASWTKENISVNSNATLAFNVGGVGEFTTGNVTTLLGNLTTNINNNGLKGGSTVGFDTANAAGGSFTIADVIANSTGTGAGSLGLTKLGANTLVLTGANTYTGTTTIQAGALELTGGGSLSDSSAVNLTGNTSAFSISGITATSETVGSLAGVAGSAVILGDRNLTFGGLGTSQLFSGVLSGVGGSLTKLGAGTQSLAGVNTYTGATTVQAGTLALLQSGSISASSILELNSAGSTFSIAGISANGTSVNGINGVNGSTISLGFKELTVGSNHSSSTFEGVLTGDYGRLKKEGSGTLTLAGANTYTGTTAIQAGSLVLSGVGSLADSSAVNLNGATAVFSIAGIAAVGETVGSLSGVAGSTVLLGTKTLTIGAANTTTSYAFSGVISGSGGLTKVGSGVETLRGANTYTGATIVSSGTLALSGLGSLADTSALQLTGSTAVFDIKNSGSETVASLTGVAGSTVSLGSSTLGVASNASTTFAGTLTSYYTTPSGTYNGGGGLSKAGTGILTLTGSNSYTGSTTISNGTLALSGAGSLHNASSVNLTGATAVFDISAITVVSQTIGALSGVAGSSVVLGGKNLTISSYGSVAEFAGNISGVGGSLTKSYSSYYGSNTQILSGTNTYTGKTTINNGTLQFAKVVSLYNNNDVSWTKENITVSSGGTLAINVGGTGEFTTGNVTTLLGNLSTGINNNGLRAGSTIGFDTSNAAGGTFTMADAIGDSTGTGGGSLNVDKLGTNTLVFSGANTYNGSTSVLGGNLTLIGSAALSNTGQTYVSGGAILDLSGITASSETVGSLGGNGQVILGGKNLAMGGGSSSDSFGGSISGSGASLTKIGSGDQYLGGTNNYTGTTAINGGTLVFQTTSALYSGLAASWTKENISVNSGTTLAFGVGSGSDFTAANITTLLANLTTGINNNGLKAGSSIGFDTGNSGSSFTYSGIIGDSTGTGAGSLGVTKIGGGTVILSGANTYSGQTYVRNGTLQFANKNALYGGNAANWTKENIVVNGTLAVNVGGMGEFSSSDMSTLLTNLSNNGLSNGGFRSGASLGIDTSNAAGPFTYSGVIVNGAQGPLGVSKLGSNELVLTGANTYTGSTVVEQGKLTLTGTNTSAYLYVESGTLALTGGGDLSNTADVRVYNGTFDISGIAASGQTIRSFSDYGYSVGSVILGNKNLTVGAGGSSSYSYGSISGVGGSITKEGSGSFEIGGTNTYTGPTTVNGGTLLLSGSSTSNLVVSNGSSLVLTGSNTGSATVNSGSFRASGTQIGNVTVNTTGTLIADGTVTGNVTSNGGTVQGNGTIIGALGVNAGGKLAPGASLGALASGTLSFANNSTYAYEVDSSLLSAAGANGGDLQKVTGDLNLSGIVNLTLTDLASNPTAFTPGTILSLINYTGSWNGGRFTFGGQQIGDEGTFTTGQTVWKLDYNAATGGRNFDNLYAGGSDSFVNITAIIPSAIPEPGSVLIAGMSALVLLRRRREA